MCVKDTELEKLSFITQRGWGGGGYALRGGREEGGGGKEERGAWEGVEKGKRRGGEGRGGERRGEEGTYRA